MACFSASFYKFFFRSQIFCYWKGHSSAKITSLRSFALLYKHANTGTSSTCISNLHSIFSAQASNMGDTPHSARTQNSGKTDSYLDFSTYPLHSTYPPYAPKGSRVTWNLPSSAVQSNFDKPWDNYATTQGT